MSDGTTAPGSDFGHWDVEHGLPVFRETVDPAAEVCRWDPMVAPATQRHWCAVGNRRFQLIADNFGTTAVWDTAHGFRWLTAAEPGTGASVVTRDDGTSWATDADRWPPTWAGSGAPERTWGPSWFSVSGAHDGVAVERTVACPEGDRPWLLVRVAVTSDEAMNVELAEEWHISSKAVPRLAGSEPPSGGTEPEVSFTTVADDHGITLTQQAGSTSPAPTTIRLAADVAVNRVETDGREWPTVRLVHRLELRPGVPTVCWFMLGLPDEQAAPEDPVRCWEESLVELRERLPGAECDRLPQLRREVPWHVALLTGGACTDAVLGEHTLDQASAYSFHFAFNGAARDPLQHALPLVYSEPELALSVLRNTCTWAAPDGEIPWAVDAAKQPLTTWFRPSDQALWSLWLAVEYAAATGDLEAFRQPLDFHPTYGVESAPLVEHLIRQFRHLVDVVGVGANGHVRILNADWNDSALGLSGVERSLMEEQGESVLNSAMAAWVLPRFAGLLRRLGDPSHAAVAAEADTLADQWRDLVAGEWNGRWYRRAHGPGAVIGDDDLWLEVQPWAILCGAADSERARKLLATIDSTVRNDSPLGARVRGPVPITVPDGRVVGEGTSGGIWFSINMTLAWAAAAVHPDLAWDELGKMTLAAHTAAYPSIWEGTISGPDAYNTPESSRPGHTWAWPSRGLAMQSFPVNNLHAHAQVVFTYLRLLGVQPDVDGSLLVGGGGGSFSSRVFELAEDGHGSLDASGPVRIVGPTGVVEGSGRVGW